jgi:hypothetical protein
LDESKGVKFPPGKNWHPMVEQVEGLSFLGPSPEYIRNAEEQAMMDESVAAVQEVVDTLA